MCDTFVVMPPATADGSVIMAKNSDREPNEAQVLEYYPAAGHPDGARVKCTHIEIPQVRETHGILLSRPFWMWGAEIGANEKNVVIGNEAVWSRMPLNKESGLTGMDMIRLALERSATADAALETMVKLLADHGQGGLCSATHRFVYHNSFIIADPAQAWVFETAGPLWAALKVGEYWAISNRLSIGREITESHPDLIETARKNGWLAKGKDFHFAHAYSDRLFTRASGSRPREARSRALIEAGRGSLDVRRALSILRDHGQDDYGPDKHLTGTRICAHAANPVFRDATQSTGSLAAHLKPEGPTFWATGTSAPCLGVFKPLWFQDSVVPDLGPAPDSKYDPKHLWWRHEALHRRVLLDFNARSRMIKAEREDLEESFFKMAGEAAPLDRPGVTETAFRLADEALARWTDQVKGQPIKRPPGKAYSMYWSKRNRQAGLVVD